MSAATLTGTGAFTHGIGSKSDYVLFLSDQASDNIVQLYSVPIMGPASAAVVLNLPLPTNGDVSSYVITPDGTQVLYLADAEVNDQLELYRVPIAGPASASQKLSLPIAGSSDISTYKISPDGSRIVYELRSCTLAVCSGVIELYSVPVAGPASAAIKIKEQRGGDTYSNFGFVISPDSRRVAYLDDQDVAETWELYSVPIVGPLVETVKLNRPLVADGDVDIFGLSLRFSADSSRIIYAADQDANGVTELYSVPGIGPSSAGIKLNKPLVTGGFVSSNMEVVESPAGARVVYLAVQDTAGTMELYSVPITGPASAGVKLNNPPPSGDSISAFRTAEDAGRVVFSGSQDTSGVAELYSVPIAGPASVQVKLNKPLPLGGRVSSFAIASDGSQVAYSASQDSSTLTELYSVPLSGPATSGVKISGAMNAGGAVNGITIAPDGGRVLYTADQQTNGVFELYIADAGAPSVAFDSATVATTETSGTLDLRVSLAHTTILPVNVQYRVSGGTATNGSDYTLSAATLSILPGQKTASIQLPLIGDNLTEGVETVSIVIESPTNATLGAISELTVLISDGRVVLPLIRK